MSHSIGNLAKAATKPKISPVIPQGIISLNADATCLTIVHPILSTENKPSSITFTSEIHLASPRELSLLMFFSSQMTTSITFRALIGGKIFPQISPIVVAHERRTPRPLSAVLNNASPIPFFERSSKNAFRFSADLSIQSFNEFEIRVNRFLACSKSPIISSNVFAQPDPKASFVVSISWVKVLTLVAASSMDVSVENF